MTPDFDPTKVDWNNPDVEYLLKHFEMAMTNQNDKITASTRTNEELRTSNEELRTEHRELEAKYEIHVGLYNRLKEKGAWQDPARREGHRAPAMPEPIGTQRILPDGAATT